jgi:light-regulated signal transduction histidine kinase (bacteriophytochrome)
MKKDGKPKDQIRNELAELRRWVAELERSEAEYKRLEACAEERHRNPFQESRDAIYITSQEGKFVDLDILMALSKTEQVVLWGVWQKIDIERKSTMHPLG